MKDTRFNFDNFPGDTYSYAQRVGMEQSRYSRIEHMSAADRQRLAVQRAWVIELQVRYRMKNTVPCKA